MIAINDLCKNNGFMKKVKHQSCQNDLQQQFDRDIKFKFNKKD